MRDLLDLLAEFIDDALVAIAQGDCVTATDSLDGALRTIGAAR